VVLYAIYAQSAVIFKKMTKSTIITNYASVDLAQTKAYQFLLNGYSSKLLISLEPEMTKLLTQENCIISVQELLHGLVLVDEYYKEETELESKLYELYYDSIYNRVQSIIECPREGNSALLPQARQIAQSIFNTVRSSIFKVYHTLVALDVPSLDAMECLYKAHSLTQSVAVFELRSYEEINNRVF
jgi:hypothetical protein